MAQEFCKSQVQLRGNCNAAHGGVHFVVPASARAVEEEGLHGLIHSAPVARHSSGKRHTSALDTLAISS